MQEGGFLNRELSRSIARMGHQDELIVSDAGLAIPEGVDTVDLALTENKPRVPEVLAVLKRNFSIEKVVIAEETLKHSPSMFKEIRDVLGAELPLETIPHSAFKARSRNAKLVIRTGDFTAYANVLLISGGGDRWFTETA